MDNQEETQSQDQALKAAVEAIVYVADEPVTVEQICKALKSAQATQVHQVLEALQQEYSQEGHGIEIREIASGYKMFTKAEHHETIRKFVKDMTPPVKLSMAALETLATIAYRQPITIPEIQQIRGVHAVSVLKTLLEKKLITTAGRKNVLGRPILYKTTREFLLQFGLSSLQELPSLQEFEEITRAAMGEPSEEQPDTGDAADSSAGLFLSEQALSEQSPSEQSSSEQADPPELRSKAAQSAAAGGSESPVSSAAPEKLHDPDLGDTDGA
ncbi:MAG: SMC-Scp complex subunit ScpB [Acidobacteria bacterium]|nr:SMC-Scp complex subunit ScpB [Acidobacteriota bacterium]